MKKSRLSFFPVTGYPWNDERKLESSPHSDIQAPKAEPRLHYHYISGRKIGQYAGAQIHMHPWAIVAGHEDMQSALPSGRRLMHPSGGSLIMQLLFLSIAIASEVIATSALKSSDGFTGPGCGHPPLFLCRVT